MYCLIVNKNFTLIIDASIARDEHSKSSNSTTAIAVVVLQIPKTADTELQID